MEQSAAPIQWEAVKALAMVVGVREAARRMQLSEDQVRKRCQREGWLKDPLARQAAAIGVAERTGKSLPVPLSPMSPATLIAAEIASLSGKTRLSLGRGMARAAEHVETLTGDEILERAQDVKAIAQTSGQVFGWQDGAPVVKLRLDMLAASPEPPTIDVQAEVTQGEWTDEPESPALEP